MPDPTDERRFVYVQCGPRKYDSYERRWRRYLESRAGGGLWDRTRATGLSASDGGATAADVERYDAEDMRSFVHQPGLAFSERDREIFIAYYEDGMSLGQAANALGWTRAEAKNALRTLRRRMEHWKGIRKLRRGS